MIRNCSNIKGIGFEQQCTIVIKCIVPLKWSVKKSIAFKNLWDSAQTVSLCFKEVSISAWMFYKRDSYKKRVFLQLSLLLTLLPMGIHNICRLKFRRSRSQINTMA